MAIETTGLGLLQLVKATSLKTLPLTIHNPVGATPECSCACSVISAPHVVRVAPDGWRYRASWPLSGNVLHGFSEPWSDAVPEDACRDLLAKLETAAQIGGHSVGEAWRGG